MYLETKIFNTDFDDFSSSMARTVCAGRRDPEFDFQQDLVGKLNWLN